MFDSYQYRSNYDAANHRATDPQFVHIYVYSDGRVRVQRRCENSDIYLTGYRKRWWDRFNHKSHVYRMDRWYSSFDEIIPLLTAMTQGNRYVLHTPVELEPAVMTAEERAYQARMVRNRKRNFCVLDPMPF